MKQFNHSSYNHQVMRKWQSPSLNLVTNLIYPLFISDQDDDFAEIESLPGQYHVGVNNLEKFMTPLIEKGLQSVILFGVIKQELKKDSHGSFAYNKNTPVIKAIKLLKEKFESLFVIADVCICQYTTHGHCYVPTNNNIMANNKTLVILTKIALAYAAAGADMVAPSGMMTGITGLIKKAFKEHDYFDKCPVMPYSAKFHSSLYGPFRKSALSSPTDGDRSQYQLPPGSRHLAIMCVEKDLNDGGDAIIVKPAGEYLDIIYELSTKFKTLICAYQVSGEYLSIKKSAENGVFDMKARVIESITALKRSGATMIITYFAPEILEWLSW